VGLGSQNFANIFFVNFDQFFRYFDLICALFVFGDFEKKMGLQS
jgi:hypothetical protein